MAETRVDDPGSETHTPAPHSGRHPGPREYIRIAIILGVITAAEVAVYSEPGPDNKPLSLVAVPLADTDTSPVIDAA